MIDIPGFRVEEKIYDPDPQEILRYRREFETTRRLNVAGIPRPFGLERVSNRLISVDAAETG